MNPNADASALEAGSRSRLEEVSQHMRSTHDRSTDCHVPGGDHAERRP
jgi:hypothetical protein